jgi:hypothetical protein
VAYRANPFLERMSEKTSDQEFVRLFSPKILERLDEDAFTGGVTLVTSPPGGGKTTLLRAFTPLALRAFWNARLAPEMLESYQRLLSHRVLHDSLGPQMLGVSLTCASGYADLPPGALIAQEGLFRALLDCRVILKALRSLASLMGYASTDQIEDVRLGYGPLAQDLKAIPLEASVQELVRWAERREQDVYEKLDSLDGDASGLPMHVRFESVLWLQSVQFLRDGKELIPHRLLMIDDVQKLRKKQRALLIEELVELRPGVPVWLAQRSVALGNELLSQGAREGRDLRVYPLEEMWTGKSGTAQFITFAQSILDRRLDLQRAIPAGAFSQYLEDQLSPTELQEPLAKGLASFRVDTARYAQNIRYIDWLASAEAAAENSDYDSLISLYVTRILIARQEARRQMTLELGALPLDDLEDRDSKVINAAAIMCHEELKVPYYFGIKVLCTLATGNVEELLNIAAHLYEGMRAMQVLRKQPEPRLSPLEQERRIKEAARRKRDFIPKSHTEGTRAQRLLDGVGAFLRERTFLPNAPYAPGVTGVRLTQYEIGRLAAGNAGNSSLLQLLGTVLAECVAENLLTTRPSESSGSRDAGTVFYLNRTLCAFYDLPLGYGGWQDVSAEALITWMELGPSASVKKWTFEGVR